MTEIKDRVTTLALGASSLALALAPIFFLFWLMQPKVLANPGVGALRLAGTASHEPFLDDAEPPQSAEPPRRESAARLTQHDPQHREAAISAQRKRAVSPRTAAQDHQTRPRLRAIFGRASALEWPRARRVVRVSGISACGASSSNATGHFDPDLDEFRDGVRGDQGLCIGQRAITHIGGVENDCDR